MISPGRLVFVGEAVLDVTTWVPGLPTRGGDVLAVDAALTPGGGFNVMAAAARQGLPVIFAGRHGAGPAGDTVRAALVAEGVTVHRRADPAPDTGFVVTMVQPDGERTFVTSPASLLGLDADGLAGVPAVPGDIVYVSGYGLLTAGGPALARWVAALDPGVTVLADPGSLAAELPRPLLVALLQRADWWSCNRREAALLTGLADATAAAGVLAGRRPDGGVVVRDGAAGCVVVERSVAERGVVERSVAAPAGGVWLAAPAIDVVDTTGAGDTHVGVFVAGLAEGLGPLEAARRATVAAAISVTRRGPATAPGRDELDRWMSDRRGVVGPNDRP